MKPSKELVESARQQREKFCPGRHERTSIMLYAQDLDEQLAEFGALVALACAEIAATGDGDEDCASTVIERAILRKYVGKEQE